MNEKTEENLLSPGMDIKPPIESIDQVIFLAEKHYGVRIKSITEMNAYDDKNYHIIINEKNINNPHMTDVWPHGYVLKIMNSLDSQDIGFVDAQNQLMLHICSRGIKTTEPIKNIEGKYYKSESFKSSGSRTSQHVIRLLKYQPGLLLKNVTASTSSLSKLFLDVGIKTAIINNHMKEFHHDAYNNRTSVWQMKNVPKIKEFLFAVKDAEKVKLVLNVLDEFENTVLNKIDHLQGGLIHGDLNESNILVESYKNDGNETTNEHRVCAIIDYGDTHISAYILELAITLCYMLLQSNIIDSGASVVQGYHKMNPLPISEYKLLPISVCARLCQSLVIGLYTAALDPTNQYVLQTQSAGWQLLVELTTTEREKINNLWLRNIA